MQEEGGGDGEPGDDGELSLSLTFRNIFYPLRILFFPFFQLKKKKKLKK